MKILDQNLQKLIKILKRDYVERYIKPLINDQLAEAKRVSSVKKKPVLMIVTKDSSHVLYCEELPDKYTDEYVIGKLKEYGG